LSTWNAQGNVLPTETVPKLPPRFYGGLMQVPIVAPPATPAHSRGESFQNAAGDWIEQRIDGLLGEMTIREKLGQLTQIFSGDAAKDWDAVRAGIRRGEVGAFIWALQDPVLRDQLQREAVENSRLGIPILFGMDIIHGARTVFPIGLGLACAFSPELFEETQKVAAVECRRMGIDWIFAPMCDLARDPRWGRVAESCGEDPYLGALCSAAQVRGLQWTKNRRRSQAACLKHFVGYSEVVGGRDYNESDVGDWVLLNQHLPAFHAGIEEEALTVMSSFNTVDGIPMAANARLLTEVLRDRWKFTGFVVSDWHAVGGLVDWGCARDRAEAARLALRAGNDMDMISGCFLSTLEEEVSAGRVALEEVDQAVRRVLRIKLRIGLFDSPYIRGAKEIPLRRRRVALARRCVAESVVLLTNHGVLPLSRDVSRIALIGPFADDPHEMLGCWAEWGRPEDVVTLAAGLRGALSENVILDVVKGCGANPLAPPLRNGNGGEALEGELRNGFLEAISAASAAELVIMAIGENRSWTGESGSRAELGLTGAQQELFDAVAELGKPMVSIVFSGRPLSLPKVWEKSGAVLYAWQPGIQAGAGIADVLFGDRPPSGRLCMSVLQNIGQTPLYYNHSRTGRPGEGQLREGRLEQAAFWFGHGLTYTSFRYGPVRIADGAGPGAPSVAVAEIENTGPRAGVETVQLYIRQTSCHEGVRPQQELRGFRKIALDPGEKREVAFVLDGKVLGYRSRSGAWKVDAGDYLVWIAPRALAGEPARYFHLA
jgi:beta-glucosidase